MTTTAPGAPPPSHDLTPGWGQSLGDGAAGVALLHIEYARTGAAGWDTVDLWAAAMTRDAVTAHPDACGLYRGAPAVAYTLQAAGRPAYALALDDLDRHITAMTEQRLEQAHQRIDRGQLPALSEFDLITGLTGIGVYLLRRHGDSRLCRDVLSYLVRLTEPAAVDGQTLPGWWTRHGPDDRPSPRWSGGHGNLGMAHGIAGPLALLSLATKRGVSVDGQADAISRICTWFDDWRQSTPAGAWWPGTLTLTEWQLQVVQQPGPQRPSWCYGTPGLARAQQLAGKALGDRRRQQDAETALAACIRDHSQLAQLGDASLCHGWAGLLQTVWRAAHDTGPDSDLAALVPELQARMDHHLRKHRPPQSDGLLEGQAGIQLVQQTTASRTPPASRWDACLLLDD